MIRMQPLTVGEATRTPGVRVHRMKELLKNQTPHICVVRGEGLGDVITTTPTVAALKEQFPKSLITYATNTRYLGGALTKVLQYNPHLAQIIDRDNFKENDYDLVVNLHCPCIGYEKHENPPVSRIDIFAHHAGLRLSDPVPQYYIQKGEILDGQKFLGPAMSDCLMMVQPTSSAQRRSLEHSKLKEAMMSLYEHAGVRSLIVTHSSDWTTNVIWNNIPGAIMVQDKDVRQLAGIMAHCDLVLCPDSSIMHLAAAMNIPTVALFGPTHPAARINHYKNAVAIWGGEGINACPCWYTACPVNTVCWSRITSERIVQTCIQHLNQTSRINPANLLKKSNIQTEIL